MIEVILPIPDLDRSPCSATNHKNPAWLIHVDKKPTPPTLLRVAGNPQQPSASSGGRRQRSGV